MSFKILHASDTDSWPLFPKAIQRIRTFCNLYDSDVNQYILVEYLKLSFVSPQPTAFVMVAVDDNDGYVWGHLLCISEKWFGDPSVTIVQMEKDKAYRLSKSDWLEGWKALKTFCWFHHAKYLQVAARSRAAARLFVKQGFSEKRILLRMNVEPVEGRASNPSE